ncbi:MAG: tetraacyldisaccharide 4'-kinase [Nitrospinota bacterium]|nr:tetraacyldisaccharide 4'-kinase [Nitrospinota bacterium]
MFENLRTNKPWESGISPFILVPLSFLYEGLYILRLFLYIIGLRRQEKVDGIKIISIGNLTVGGTGKTPFTIWLARRLEKLNISCAIVSRGYGRRSTSPVQVVSDGKTLLDDYPEAADEALLCAQTLKSAPVICSPKRTSGIKHARDAFKTDAVILDDAFSHISAGRDLNILLIDAVNPFGNGKLLPAGPMREPAASIRRADAVVITRANMVDKFAIRKIENFIRPFIPEESIHLADFKPGDIVSGSDEMVNAEEFLAGKTVYLLSGIASPGQFEETVKGLKAEIKDHFAFSDHYKFTKEDMEFVLENSGKNIIITTEKDFVRIPAEYRSKFFRLTIELSLRRENAFLPLVEKLFQTSKL